MFARFEVFTEVCKLIGACFKTAHTHTHTHTHTYIYIYFLVLRLNFLLPNLNGTLEISDKFDTLTSSFTNFGKQQKIY